MTSEDFAEAKRRSTRSLVWAIAVAVALVPAVLGFRFWLSNAPLTESEDVMLLRFSLAVARDYPNTSAGDFDCEGFTDSETQGVASVEIAKGDVFECVLFERTDNGEIVEHQVEFEITETHRTTSRYHRGDTSFLVQATYPDE